MLALQEMLAQEATRLAQVHYARGLMIRWGVTWGQILRSRDLWNKMLPNMRAMFV